MLRFFVPPSDATVCNGGSDATVCNGGGGFFLFLHLMLWSAMEELVHRVSSPSQSLPLENADRGQGADHGRNKWACVFRSVGILVQLMKFSEVFCLEGGAEAEEIFYASHSSIFIPPYSTLMAMYQITFSPTDIFLSVAATSFASNDTNWDHQPFDCAPFKHLSLAPSPPNPTAAHPIELTFPPLSYRVLRLNQTDRTMTLARSDLWIGTTRTRLTEFTNTTLNSALLNYSPDNEDLTIFYGSSNFTLKPSNLFNCSINGTSSTAFYLTGPILNIATCSVGVRLNILQTVAHELTSNRITLREALMEGFNVNFSDCGIQPCRTPGFGDLIMVVSVEILPRTTADSLSKAPFMAASPKHVKGLM
ncbi:hypothetical protein SO802_002422 [Lithocarpus litseifolius]|uniref:Uncharacterized protein n=1 Tax=Lithocarpus litseifolius TaxID=425828 RepID=A0AAW2E0U3_9ROSI